MPYRWFAVLFGCSMIAIGIDFFLLPIKVLDGGMIGVALIVKYVFNTKVGLTLIVCSIPIFILTWIKDRSVFFNSLLGLLTLALAIDLLDSYTPPFVSLVKEYPFISAILGGLLSGGGFGMLLRHQASTGGIDLLAKLIATPLKMNVGIIILITDFIIVILGGILFSANTFFLTIAAISTGGVTTSLCTINGTRY
ncbi:MAG: YitT family protein [Candidatus Cohnella colombiensis]|uniref:YitT family protein n=1 Tax=Candidatus Cohnella colombiensis TaxID=3121368 RepID=A0AA95EZI7_9BACL|nr:MAG: YitT family protein [Cohnella sp.]